MKTAKRLRDRHLTPESILGPVREMFGGDIDLDPCTDEENPVRAKAFYAPPDDGCTLSWDYPTVYCSPPAEDRLRWVQRCIDAQSVTTRIVLLLPAYIETPACQLALSKCWSAVFVAGRHGLSHGSILFGFGGHIWKIHEHIGGVFMRPQ